MPNADGLSECEMLAIARELNNSETAFVFQSDGPDHDLRIRYFTPLVEVPICGHATVAAHYVRALENQLPSTIVIQKIKAGLLPVEIVKRDSNYFINMTQGAIEFDEPIVDPIRREIIDGLGLAEADMDEHCPMQFVSTGHGKIMVGIKARNKLDSLEPDMYALKRLSASLGCNGYYVFTFDSHIAGVLTHGRMFAPASGVPEDPVTGNANAPFGAYLIKHRLVGHDGQLFSFKAEQGTAMGRSGMIEVQVMIEKDEPVQVKIGGQAVVVFKAELTL